MAKLTRRELLFGSAAAAATLAAGPAFAGSGSYTLGPDLFKQALKECYGNKTPESLQRKIGPKFWKADDIEKAFAGAWEKVKGYESAVRMAEEYRKGNNSYFNELTTLDGGINKSVPTVLNSAFGNYAELALDRMKDTGVKGNDFNYVGDIGLQAFILNVGKGDEGDLAKHLGGVAALVKGEWSKGFEQFVENTLKPSLAIAPVVAPTAPEPLKFK